MHSRTLPFKNNACNNLKLGDIRIVKIIYKWFDYFTQLIPPEILTIIRGGTLIAWLGFTIYLVTIYWQAGSQAGLKRSKNTPLVQIKEKITRKRNLRQAPHIILPDLEDLSLESPDRNPEEGSDNGIFPPTEKNLETKAEVKAPLNTQNTPLHGADDSYINEPSEVLRNSQQSTSQEPPPYLPAPHDTSVKNDDDTDILSLPLQ